MKSTPTNNIGAPIWMNEEEDEEVNLSRNPSKSATSSSSTYEQGSLSQHGCTTKGFIYISFRFIAISLSLLMAATAILGLSKFIHVVLYFYQSKVLSNFLHTLGMISGVDQSGRVFVGIYMFFFASLLFIFELNQIRQFESIDHMFKRNFGFMYSTSGNALFIIL